MFFSGIALNAGEYNNMTIDELMSLRGVIPVEDLGLYITELTQRVKTMNDNDLRKYGILNLIKDEKNFSDAQCSCTLKSQKLHATVTK